jgi:hypothetical protein
MLKIIKKYWMPIAIALGALVLAIIKLDQHQFAFSFVALALLLVAVKNLLLQMEYDELHDSHADLVIQYIKELNNNLEFIQKSKATLLDIMTSVDGVSKDAKDLNFEGIIDPITGDVDRMVVTVKPKKKRGRPKKKA